MQFKIQTDAPKDSLFKIGSLKDSFRHTPKTIRLSWSAAPYLTLTLGVLTCTGALLPLAVAYVGKLIIDAVVAGQSDSTLSWVLLELGLISLQTLNFRAFGLNRQLLGARLSITINLMILEKSQTLDLKHFEDPEFYDRLTRARREASSRPLSVITDSFQLLQNSLTLAGFIALLLSYNSWAVLGLFLSSLPAAYSELRFSSAAFRLRNWRAPETRQLNYMEFVLTNDTHAKEVKVLKIGRRLIDRYRTLAEKLFREDKQLAKVRTVWGYLLSLLSIVAFYGCYAVMAIGAAAGRMTLGQLTLYIAAFRQGQQSFQSILNALGSMYENNLYMSNLFSYLEESALPLPPAALPAPAVIREEGIRFEKVGFRYAGQDRWALKDIDLFIPKGQSLALVGHNGAGKTTFIKLLTGLYEATEGRILVDGVDIRALDKEALHRRIAVVFQDFNRYQLTFAENVSIGSVEHEKDEERLMRAVASGGARDVLDQLPLGIQSPLGRWFQNGSELSGGQWQKIALARAFMREEADILILDEPTAALDADAEYAVFERFRQLTQGRTSILISHRFPTVRMADRIVVIEGGKIIEEGTHTSLVAQNGRYAHLFKAQASGYL